MTPKKVHTLSTPDAAYIAGIIDGEGTVTLTRKHKNENRQLVVSISSNERNILEFVLIKTGVGKITTKKTYQAHHQAAFAYAITNRQALNLLEQIFPYLQSYKKTRAELVLNNYIKLTPRNGKYTDELIRKRTEFEETF